MCRLEHVFLSITVKRIFAAKITNLRPVENTE
jgi:hypothetical protein